MATINVLDASGSTVAVARVADTGRAAAAASLGTVMSTEDKAALDAAVTDLAAIEVLQTAGNALLGTIDADTGNAVTALQIMDDWDESDRAKVNVIVGQAGVAAGAGAVGATVIRTTQASDSPLVAGIGAVGDTAVTNPASSASVIAALKGLLDLIGDTNTQLPASLGSKSVAASLATSVKSGGNEYETVAASQTTQTLGATGATGDYLEGLTCVVSTAATSQVQIKDGADTAITVLPNSVGAGVGSYYIPLGLTSRTGAWQITTAAGVAVIATGDFT